MESLNGKVVNSPAIINLIKNRNELLNRQKIETINDDIKYGRPIKVFPEHIEALNEYGKTVYLLKCVMEDGRKTDVILENIVLYLYIRKLEPSPICPAEPGSICPAEPSIVDTLTDEQFTNNIRTLLCEQDVKIEQVYAKGIEKFEILPVLHLKVICNNLKVRTQVADIITKYNSNIKFTNNDLTHHERLICRDHDIKLGSYNIISKFKSYKKEKDISKLEKIFRINVNDIKYDDSITPVKTMLLFWDIETRSKTIELPDANRPGDTVFMIALSVKWCDGTDILKICFTTFGSCNRPEFCTVMCINEKDLILCMFKVINKLQCDYIIGYNDGDYDWSFIIDKCAQYDILKEAYHLMETTLRYTEKNITNSAILLYKCRKSNIKIDGSLSAISRTLTVSSIIMVDLRTICRQLFPLAVKTKLSYFLDYLNLPNKTGLELEEMKRICNMSEDFMKDFFSKLEKKQSDKKSDILNRLDEIKKLVGEVAYYNFTDADVLYKLFKKLNVLNDRRETASSSFTTIRDAYFTANRVKLINIVMKEFYINNIIPTQYKTDIRENNAIEGAKVYYPRMGLKKPALTLEQLRDKHFKTVSNEEISILINHITLNGIKPNNTITGILSDMYNTFLSSFKNNRPSLEEDFMSLYPSIMMAYNLSPECMIDKSDIKQLTEYTINDMSHSIQNKHTELYSIGHNTLDGKTVIDDSKKTYFGVYPTVLLRLFNSRVKLRETIKKIDPADEYMIAYLDSKQKFIKVVMNSLYGSLACFIPNSVIFNYFIASIITYKGRCMVELSKNYLESVGCIFDYGDTDSAYIELPKILFEELDIKYYTNEIKLLDYCEQSVKIVKFMSKKYTADINNYIKSIIKNDFLKMSPGGVFYPMFFPGIKKTAFGINHEHRINFDATFENLYEKGVQMKKRGASNLLIVEGRNIELDIINIYNTDSQEEIVKKYIHKLFTIEYPIEIFIKNISYRADKKNIAVIEYKNRMDVRNDPRYPSPKNGERFNVVVADYYPYVYDIKGNKRILKVGECYESVEYMKDKGIQPDLKFYISRSILGLCSMILLPHFYIDTKDKEFDIELGLKNSKKYVEQLCNIYKKEIVCKGPIYKKIYSDVKKTILDNSFLKDYTGGSILQFLVGNSKKTTSKECNKRASYYLNKNKPSVSLQLLFKNNILPIMKDAFNKKMSGMSIDENKLNVIISQVNNHIEKEVYRLREYDDKKIQLMNMDDIIYIQELQNTIDEIVKKYMTFECIYEMILKINSKQNLFVI